jgi:hypothetical protein
MFLLFRKYCCHSLRFKFQKRKRSTLSQRLMMYFSNLLCKQCACIMSKLQIGKKRNFPLLSHDFVVIIQGNFWKKNKLFPRINFTPKSCLFSLEPKRKIKAGKIIPATHNNESLLWRISICLSFHVKTFHEFNKHQ